MQKRKMKHTSRNVRENEPSDDERPMKIQISMRIRAVRSESSQSAICIAKYVTFIHANKEDSDETAWTRRLICVFFGCTCQKG